MSVIIICRSGRSGIVSKLLDEGANYSNVYNASGGILSWLKSNNKQLSQTKSYLCLFLLKRI